MKNIFTLVTALLVISCTPNETSYEPQNFDDLIGHNVSMMEGSVMHDYCLKHLADVGIEYSYYPGVTDCMLAVRQGKSDVFFGADVQAYNEAFKEQHLRICHYADEVSAPIGYVVKKGNSVLKSRMDSFIDSLSVSGELKEAVDRWWDINNTDFHNCIKWAPIPSEPEESDNLLRLAISGIKNPAEVMIDNKWTGLEVELIQRFAEVYGYNVQICTYDFNNLIPAIQSGKADVAAATIMVNDERKAKIDFVKPHAMLRGVFIVPDKSSGEKTSFWNRVKHSAEVSLIRENRWKLIVDGLWVTIIITLFSLLGGSILGAVICWMRMSRMKWMNGFAGVYIYVMRNTPMLVLLMLLFYVVLARSGLSAMVVAIIAFSMNSSAFMSETFRTGILSVGKGQTEAGRAMGCTAFQTFFYIVAPQAAKRALPVYKNECITLLKGTSIVGYISIIDITKASDLIRSASFEAFFPLIVITLFYFLAASIISLALNQILKKL